MTLQLKALYALSLVLLASMFAFLVFGVDPVQVIANVIDGEPAMGGA